jgi:hypothetical protein
VKTPARGNAGHASPRTLRRRPSLGARVKPFWIFAILLAALAGWGGAWFVHSPTFRVARIAIDVPIASAVGRDEVRAAAAIGRDANVWLLNPWAMRRRIEAIPYVDRAGVHRGQFPQPFVELAISVRRATACVRAAELDVTIDSASRVLQAGCVATTLPRIDAGTAKLPPPGGTIADPEIRRLLGDARVLANANVGVRSLDRDQWGGLEAVDVTGVIVKFGDDGDLAKKAALVEPVRSGIGTKRPIRAIDLRSPGTPTVEFR